MSGGPTPSFAQGAATSGEDIGDTTWEIRRDVLRRTTTCVVKHGSSYDVPHGGTASEEYAGEVAVDRQTFEQSAEGECTYRLSWPDTEVRVTSTMRVEVGAAGYDVVIAADAFEGDELVSHREWRQQLPR
jgi:hypothetical protein